MDRSILILQVLNNRTKLHFSPCFLQSCAIIRMILVFLPHLATKYQSTKLQRSLGERKERSLCISRYHAPCRPHGCSCSHTLGQRSTHSPIRDRMAALVLCLWLTEEGCYAGNPREGQIAWARERASGYISARKTKLMVGSRMDFGQLDLEMSGEEVSKPHLSPIHRWHNVHRSFYSQFHDIEGI